MSDTFRAHPVQRPPAAPSQTRRPAPSSTRTVATVVLVVSGLATALAVAAAVAAWPAADALRDAYALGTPAMESDVTTYDLLGIPQFAAFLAAWVCTALWLGKARACAEAIRPFRHARSPLWNWLGWIVPVVSLWFPFQTVRDLGRASSPTMTPPPGLGWWWGAWMVAIAASQAAGRISTGGSGTEDFVAALGPVNAVGTAALVVAFVLWCRIVLSIVRDQEAATNA